MYDSPLLYIKIVIVFYHTEQQIATFMQKNNENTWAFKISFAKNAKHSKKCTNYKKML